MDIRLFSSIQVNTPLESAVGNTPLLPLGRISAHLPTSVRIFAKAEWFNPGGSVKDRPALNILRHAIANGDLEDGIRLLDSTSGNMGISYATFGSALGIPITLAMPANASPERQTVLRALGAELILTDPLEGSDGALRVAQELAAEKPDQFFYANQYNNPANWSAHYMSTGPEILEGTDCQITHFVAGLGTSGTLTGIARYLREYNPEIEVIAIQPDSPFHGLEGLKHMETSIQPGIFDPTIIDRTIRISTEESYEMVRALARCEGIFAGVSSGAAAIASLRVAEELESGVVVTVFPDSGYKYLSEDAIWDSRMPT